MEKYSLSGVDGKLLQAQAALMKVAKRESVSLETVCNEINLAIKEAMDHGDAHAKAIWEKCPRSGEYPTPEETIAFLAGMIK